LLSFGRLAVFLASMLVVLLFATISSRYYKYSVVRDRDNALYAERVFQGIVAFDEVLASGQWQPFQLEQLSPAFELGLIGGGGGERFCRFAVVRLSDEAPTSPNPVQTEGYDRAPPMFSFQGDWQPTPGPPLSGIETSSLHNCERQIGSGVVDEMADALIKAGGWWHGTPGGHDGVLHVYSKPQGIAFRLYFGD
jgi:hypothetical protein